MKKLTNSKKVLIVTAIAVVFVFVFVFFSGNNSKKTIRNEYSVIPKCNKTRQTGNKENPIFDIALSVNEVVGKEVVVKPKTYLRTQFFLPSEIVYIIFNLLEAYDYIDYFIIQEFNYDHAGNKKGYCFEEYMHLIPEDKRNKIMYMKLDLKDVIKSDPSITEHEMHEINEKFMRGAFVQFLPNLKDNDIIIGVDCDEIIYRRSYPLLFKKLESYNAKGKHIFQFGLHLMYYRVNWHWHNKKFVAPSIGYYKSLKNSFPSNWRYNGEVDSTIYGIHFSTCFEPEIVYKKLKSYAHSPRFKDITVEKVRYMMENKIYLLPIDKGAFSLKKIDFFESEMIPQSVKKNSHLLKQFNIQVEF